MTSLLLSVSEFVNLVIAESDFETTRSHEISVALSFKFSVAIAFNLLDVLVVQLNCLTAFSSRRLLTLVLGIRYIGAVREFNYSSTNAEILLFVSLPTKLKHGRYTIGVQL